MLASRRLGLFDDWRIVSEFYSIYMSILEDTVYMGRQGDYLGAAVR